MSGKRLSVDSVFLGRYTSKRKLGKGAFGDVFLVEEQPGGPQFALKIIDRKKMEGENESLVEYLLGEVACMKEMNEQHIVRLADFAEDEDYFYMVMEYCDGGDLMNLQAVQPDKVFSLALAAQYLSQVIHGLQVLHKRGYLHRDIKPQNVLVKNVNGQKVFKIADFGFTKKAKNVGGTVLGTEQFMAPEIYRQGVEDIEDDDAYGYEVDMWAFGVLFFYMLNLSYPFEINPYWTLAEKCKELTKQAEQFSYRKAVANTRKKNLANCTDEVEDLFRKIFRIDQQKRITFSQIRQHPVFASYFPKPSPESKILYATKFKSSILKGKMKNRLQEKASELGRERQRLGIPSSICVEQQENSYAQEKHLLKLQLQEINYLSQVVDEVEVVEKELGLMPSLLFSFNLIKYHIVLLSNFMGNLNHHYYSKKYPNLDWNAYFSTPEFASAKRSYATDFVRSNQRYKALFRKCKGQYRELCKLNEYFGPAFDEQIVETQFGGDFFRSYRKSTDIVYVTLKDYLKTNKVLKFYYFLCVTCIVHVFNDLYESEELKRDIFSAFLLQVTDQQEQRISYEKLGHYLRNSAKPVLLKLAKKIIEDVMTMKK